MLCRKIDTSLVIFNFPDTKGWPEKGPEKLTINQQKMIDAVRNNPYVTREELVKIVGISLSKIKANIAKLKVKGILERIGPDKGGHWQVIDKNWSNIE
jgi:predicted HTH transcriptional regulator